MLTGRCPRDEILLFLCSLFSQMERYVTFGSLWIERGRPLAFLAASPPRVFNPIDSV
jgi:hypothetical protein